MYIEETGADDGSIGHYGDIRIDGEGGSYSVEANYDFDGDGVDDAARITTDQGFTAYVDEDHDGRADLARTSDHREAALGQSRFDPATGRWLPEQPAPTPPLGASARAENSLVLDTPQGLRDVGPATEDTNGNGRDRKAHV